MRVFYVCVCVCDFVCVCVCQTFVDSRRPEQLHLRTQQHIMVTAEDSVLRTEIVNLEYQEEDAPSVCFGSSR